MATVTIKFDVAGVSVVTGDIPPNDQTPIDDPEQTPFVTNKAFIVEENVYCFGLQTAIPHTPLWHVVQAINGVAKEFTFHRIAS